MLLTEHIAALSDLLEIHGDMDSLAVAATPGPSMIEDVEYDSELDAAVTIGEG